MTVEERLALKCVLIRNGDHNRDEPWNPSAHSSKSYRGCLPGFDISEVDADLRGCRFSALVWPPNDELKTNAVGKA